MWDVDYYTRPNGRKPAKEWIDDQDNSIKPSIDNRIEKLKAEGLFLRENKMLVPIREKPGGKVVPNFYELRSISKKWRLAIYHDRKKNIFMLISGWRKLQRVQESDVQRALRLLEEYLSMEGG
jgi:hypothetical protein